ncbi:hypothetical protein HRbin21_00238 [bacterium HR21]|nr:hypothetical protein HRbin21_00238 [bacterium HR21]
MLDRHSKIRAFALGAVVCCGVLPGRAQVSGVGVVVPVYLSNPALVGQFERYGWLGYEPSRFGLPELHWGMLGVVVPGTGWWSWGAELRGRATGKFSQLSLRTAIGLGVTDFFHAGVATEVVRYAVEGVPARWWGRMDLGARVQVAPRLKAGVSVEDVVPRRWGRGVGVGQRVTVGWGWEEEGWGASVDAVIATLAPPTFYLTTNTTPIPHTTLTLQLGSSPPQVRFSFLVRLREYALECTLGFHSALGWSQRFVLLYRWGE